MYKIIKQLNVPFNEITKEYILLIIKNDCFKINQTSFPSLKKERTKYKNHRGIYSQKTKFRPVNVKSINEKQTNKLLKNKRKRQVKVSKKRKNKKFNIIIHKSILKEFSNNTSSQDLTINIDQEFYNEGIKLLDNIKFYQQNVGINKNSEFKNNSNSLIEHMLINPLNPSPLNYKSMYFPFSTTNNNNNSELYKSGQMLISPINKEIKLQNKVLIKDETKRDSEERNAKFKTVNEVNKESNNHNINNNLSSGNRFDRGLTLDLDVVNTVDPLITIQGILSVSGSNNFHHLKNFEDANNPLTLNTLTDSENSFNYNWDLNMYSNKGNLSLDRIFPETTTNKWMLSLNKVPAISPIKASFNISPKSSFVMNSRYFSKE